MKNVQCEFLSVIYIPNAAHERCAALHTALVRQHIIHFDAYNKLYVDRYNSSHKFVRCNGRILYRNLACFSLTPTVSSTVCVCLFVCGMLICLDK